MLDLRDTLAPAESVIRALGLRPHPEGGHFRETWRDQPEHGGRGSGTAILFLLAESERSHWHRVDAAELWVWQAGAVLALSIAPPDQPAVCHTLGPDLAAAQSLQQLVPPGHWQTARSLGRWTLVTCVVAPAFSFSGFELAPLDWRPPD
jgi:uncharacterized protein